MLLPKVYLKMPGFITGLSKGLLPLLCSATTCCSLWLLPPHQEPWFLYGPGADTGKVIQMSLTWRKLRQGLDSLLPIGIAREGMWRSSHSVHTAHLLSPSKLIFHYQQQGHYWRMTLVLKTLSANLTCFFYIMIHNVQP